MAIHINCGKNTILCNKNETKVHSIPFKIHADCEAKVSEFFESSITEQKDGTFNASFRGYPLRGQRVQLPKNYIGLVLHESIPPVHEKEERKFHVIHKFETLSYWNWDKAPGKNDKIIQALEWVDIAEALHNSIIEE